MPGPAGVDDPNATNAAVVPASPGERNATKPRRRPPLIGIGLGRPVPHLDSRPLVTRKRDVKQFRQACRQVRLSARERYEASEALHREKQSSGVNEHMSYQELVAWLREWKGTNGQRRSS